MCHRTGLTISTSLDASIIFGHHPDKTCECTLHIVTSLLLKALGLCMPKSLQGYSLLCYGCCVTGQMQLWAFGRTLKIDIRWRDWNMQYTAFAGNTLTQVKGITQSTPFSLLLWLVCLMLESLSPSPAHLSCASSLVPNFWKSLAYRMLIASSKHSEVICWALLWGNVGT